MFGAGIAMPSQSTSHRQCVVSYLAIEEALSRFEQRCFDIEKGLIVSHSSLFSDVTPPISSLRVVNFNGLQRQLGQSYEAIFLDFSTA